MSSEQSISVSEKREPASASVARLKRRLGADSKSQLSDLGRSHSVAGVVCLLSFLVTVAIIGAGRHQPAEQKRRGELVRIIEQRRQSVSELDAKVSSLRSKVRIQQALVSNSSSSTAAQRAELDVLTVEAAAAGLEGKGIQVRMSDSTRTPRHDDDVAAFTIHDSDVQVVVNELFAAGADGVAVNGIRVTATSPIRAAGATIVVNFRPVAPPYTIEAVGLDIPGFRSSATVKRFERWRELFGLGLSLKNVNRIELPPYAGRLSTGVAIAVEAAPTPKAAATRGDRR